MPRRNETRVFYKAIADFSNIFTEAAKAKKAMQEMRDVELDSNKKSVASNNRRRAMQRSIERGNRQATESAKQLAKETTKSAEAIDDVVDSSKGLTMTEKAWKNVAAAAKKTGKESKDTKKEVVDLNAVLKEGQRTLASFGAGKAARDLRNFGDEADYVTDRVSAMSKGYSTFMGMTQGRNFDATKKVNLGDVNYGKFKDEIEDSREWMDNAERFSVRFADSMRKARQEARLTAGGVDKVGDSLKRAGGWADDMGKKMFKLNNFRLHLMPPFVALIPILAAVISLVNPLVAGIGALGTASLGLAANLGSLAGAAVAAIPGLAALLSVVGALKMAFSGFGSVFKAYQATQTAGAGGGGGGAGAGQLSQTEEITRANERYRRSIEDVKFAQEDLTKAKQDYIDRLKALKDALDDATKSEGLARDRMLLSAEFATDVADDANVSDADKQAAADFAEYQAEQYKEAQKTRKEAEKQYNETKKTGVEQDRAVVMAKRAVTDAVWAQRDAELALKKAQSGSGGAGGSVSAAQKYQEALAKLSPSARRAATTLIDLYEAWKKNSKIVQENFFSRIVDSLGRLKGMLPTITDYLNDAAGALGDVADDFLKLVTSDKIKTDLELISPTNVSLIKSFGKILESMVTTFSDLAVAAGPFTASLGDRLAKGAENFSKLVANARETGQLATWLQTVETRLSQWWRIVKNIGQTLFNYGAAASPLGQWITDGVEKMTEAWKNASETAREEGSPFQQYLSDIEPALTEVRKLFGSFFSWFSKESKDPDNLGAFTSIVKSIRTELGPAISRLLDSLNNSDIGHGLISALAQILDFISKITEKGAGEGFITFFETMSTLFQTASDILNIFPDWVIENLVRLLGVLAALSFTRLLGFFAALKLFAGSSAIASMVTGFGSFTKLVKDGGFLSAVGTVTKARWDNLKGAATGLAAAGTAGEAGAKGLTRFGKAARFASSAAGPIAIALTALTLIIGAFGNRSEEERQRVQGLTDTLDEQTGAVTENTRAWVDNELQTNQALAIKQAQDLGISYQTLTDAMLGNSDAQAVVNAKIEEGKQKQRDIIAAQAEASGGWNDTAQALGTVEGSYADLSNAVFGTSNSLKKAQAQAKYMNTGLANMSDSADDAADSTEGAASAVDKYREAVKKLIDQQKAEADKVFAQRKAEDDYAAAKANANAALADAEREKNETGKISAETYRNLQSAQDDVLQSSHDLATATYDLDGNAGKFNKTIQDGTTWAEGYQKKLGNIAGKGDAANTALKNMKTTADALDGTQIDMKVVIKSQGLTAIQTIMDWIKNTPEGKNFNAYMSNPNYVSPSTPGGSKVTKTGMQAKYFGGIIRRAGGGGVPGTGIIDKVAAMLTPGEFVLRKAVVSRLGVDNLERVNAGTMALSDLLRRAMESENHGTAASPRDSKFSFSSPPPITGGDGPKFDDGKGDGGAPTTVNYNFNVYNPVGEPAEDSIIRAGQQLAFFEGWGSS